MSFLRFIKINSSNKSFLKFGIVELILVVTGILIALQVNNYNEYLKDREEEKNILLAFHYETSNNLEILNRSIQEKMFNRRTRRYCIIFRKVRENFII